MGGPNKLLAEIGGKPLVRIAAEQALASRARPVIVVTGHQRDARRGGARRPAGPAGAQSRLRRGSRHLGARRHRRSAGERDGAVICLGDMPQVDADLIDRLDRRLRARAGRARVVPTIQGKRGNPVLWSRRFFPDLMALEGDVGARNLIGRYGEAVTEVPVTGKAALTDIDTQEALAGLKAEIEGASPPCCCRRRRPEK